MGPRGHAAATTGQDDGRVQVVVKGPITVRGELVGVYDIVQPIKEHSVLVKLKSTTSQLCTATARRAMFYKVVVAPLWPQNHVRPQAHPFASGRVRS